MRLNLCVAFLLVGCQPQLTLEGNTQLQCDSSNDCPTGMSCEPTLHRCIRPGENEKPSVDIGAIDRSLSIVTIPVVVFDLESNPVTLTVEFDRGEGFSPALNVAVPVLIGLPDGQRVELFWDALTELGSQALQQNIRLRITPQDSTGVGTAVESEPFVFGNDAPQIQSLLIDDNEVRALGIVRINVSDTSNDPVDIIGFELSLTGDFTDSLNVPLNQGAGMPFPTGGLTGLSAGTEHAFSWSTLPYAAVFASTAAVRVTVVDIPQVSDASGGQLQAVATSATFVLRNQTPPRIVDLRAPRLLLSVGASPVPIVFTVVDEESDDVDITVDVSFDGATWVPAREHTVAQSEGRFDLASAPSAQGGFTHVFVWSAPGAHLTGSPFAKVRVQAFDGRASNSAPSELTLLSPPSPSAVAVDSGRFAPAFGYATPQSPMFTGPTHVAADAGDFNADGWLDFAVVVDPTTADPPQILVFLAEYNSSTQSLSYVTPPASYPVAVTPAGIRAVDANQDGALDLLVLDTDPAGNCVHLVLGDQALGKGVGTFAVDTAWPLGTGVQHFVAADVSGDGVVDVLMVGTVSGTISVGLGSIDGLGAYSLTHDADYNVGAEPIALTTGLFNDDDRMDFAVSDNVDESLQIWLNDAVAPTGTLFNWAQTHDAGPVPYALHSQDLNGDNKPELYLVNAATLGATLRVFAPASSGLFGSASIYATAVQPIALDFADVNQDGLRDVVVSYDQPAQSERLSVFLTSLDSQGTAILGTRNAFALQSDGPNPEAVLPQIIARDFDNDGRMDVAGITKSRNFRAGLYVYGQRDAMVGFAEPTRYGLDAPPMHPLTYDVDGDGLVDLIMRVNDDVVFMRGQGDTQSATGQLGEVIVLPLLHPAGPFAIDDLDNDARMDLVVVDTSASEVCVYFGTASELLWDFSSPVRLAFSGTATGVYLQDFSGDGLRDIRLQRAGGFDVWLSESDVVGPTQTFAASTSTSVVGVVSAIGGDINGDGLLDLVATVPFSGIAAYLGDGTGSFTSQTAVSWSGVVPNQVMADLDLDGVLDLVGAAATFLGNGTVYTARGSGDGTFAAPASIGANPGPVVPGLGHFDGNQQLDLVAPQKFGSLVELHRDLTFGPLAAGTPVLEKSGQLPQATIVADLNLDGISDVVLADSQFAEVQVALGSMTQVESWGFPLQPYMPNQNAAVTLFGSDVDGALMHRSGSLANVQTGVRQAVRTHLFGHGSFAETAGFALGFNAASVRPLSRVWNAGSHLHWQRVQTQDGARIQVAQRFGPKVLGQRDGLDLSANQRGLVVRLPIRSALTVSDLDAATVRVFRRSTNWERASDLPNDPLFNMAEGATVLPRTNGQLVVREHYAWSELPLDADNSFATGTGERFVVVFNATDAPLTAAHGFVEVLVEQLGEFQAFLE